MKDIGHQAGIEDEFRQGVADLVQPDWVEGVNNGDRAAMSW